MPWPEYGLQDFLLFAPDAYWRLFELSNAAIWPAPPLVSLLVVVVLAVRPWRKAVADYVLVALFAVAWFWSGAEFMGQRYAAINGYASYGAPLFYLQSLLLLWLGLVRRSFSAGSASRARNVTGAALIVGGTVLYPALALARGYGGGEFFGVAPDPTAIATLGLFLRARNGAASLGLLVPGLVCLAGFLTLLAMGSWQAPLPLAAVVLTVAALTWSTLRGRTTPRPAR